MKEETLYSIWYIGECAENRDGDYSGITNDPEKWIVKHNNERHAYDISQMEDEDYKEDEKKYLESCDEREIKEYHSYKDEDLLYKCALVCDFVGMSCPEGIEEFRFDAQYIERF